MKSQRRITRLTSTLQQVAKTPVGTTLENLKAAVGGETGASAHYSVYADAAEKAGYSQLAALWRATSAAEQIHIAMEYNAVTAEDPDWPRPEVTAGTDAPADLNLISSAQGEIYETSDMYPAFIKKAQEEGNNAAVMIFTRAKLAEGYHAENYMGHTTTSIRPPTSTLSLPRLRLHPPRQRLREVPDLFHPCSKVHRVLSLCA